MAGEDLDQRRAERAQAREDARDARIERDTETILNTVPSPVTATDGLGIERIIHTTTGYEAPRVEPDPKEVARLAALQTRLDNQRQARLDSHTKNADGGSKVAADALAAESSVGVASANSQLTPVTPESVSTPAEAPATPTPPPAKTPEVKAPEKNGGGS